MFNIFLNDIFYFINNGNFCNYANDNTIYSIGKSLNMVKKNVKINFLITQKWFYENHVILNPWKCHYLVLEKRLNSDAINLNGTFCSRSLNNLIKRIHELALRLIYNDHVSSFQDIPEMTKEKTIHHNNLGSLAKEIHKLSSVLYN